MPITFRVFFPINTALRKRESEDFHEHLYRLTLPLSVILLRCAAGLLTVGETRSLWPEVKSARKK